MCGKCEGFNEEIKIKSPHELYHRIEEIKMIVAEKTMSMEERNCNIDDIKRNKPWPVDHIDF